MNNKKSLLPLLVLAIVPFIIIDMSNNDADKLGKEFAAKYLGGTITVHILEENITEKQEIRRAQLIIEGTIIEVKPYWKIIDDDSHPKIFTEYTVKVHDILKGNVSGETIKVVMAGGVLDGITMRTPAVHLMSDTKVIMLLGKDVNSMYGDAYSPLSVSKSIYIINDGQATNKLDERSGTRDEIKERLYKKLN